MYYSQCGEQKYLLEYFKGKVGRFLDIGAYDGKTFSNTRALYELGWKGVCVEPSLMAFTQLQKLYKDNENIILVNKALSDKIEILDFYEGYEKSSDGSIEGTLYSSLSERHVKFWKGEGVIFRTIQVETIDWNNLFDMVGTNFNFINIDIEGLSLGAMFRMPLPRLGDLKCLCIEHEYKFQELIQYALECGFYECKVTADNLLMMKEQSK